MKYGIAIALLMLTLTAPAAKARTRPTFAEAHTAIHLALDDYAEITEGHTIAGPCRKAGAFSTMCRARIDGPNPIHYRILITGTVARNYYVTIRAR